MINKYLYWNDGAVVHSCEGSEVHPGIFLVWTECEKDVPAGKSYRLKDGDRYIEDIVTCDKCRARTKKAPSEDEAL